jgi:hypothetical protein
MIKKLFFTAALLVPGLANGADPSATLPVQIVPSGSPQAIPAGAQAAGFTTLALEADFSQPFYATQSNWLDCAGATHPQWYRAWMGFGSSIAAPCSATSQQVDPLTGKNALQIHWQDSYYNPSVLVNGAVIQTVDDSGNGLRIPPNAYFEVVARDDVPTTNGTMGLWSYTADGTSIEWDGIEIWTAVNDASTCIHNNAAGIADCIWHGTPTTGAVDFTQYHTFAWRVTSDGATAGFWCMYIDNVSQGCSNWHATAGELAGIDTTLQLLESMSCRGPAAPCNNGFGINAWIKSVRVFSCAGVNSGAKCFTSNPNP